MELTDLTDLTDLFVVLADIENSLRSACSSLVAGEMTQAFRQRAQANPESLEARIGELDDIVELASGWTAFVLGSTTVPHALAVHRVAALALAVDRYRDRLLDPSLSASNAMHDDLGALASVARGEAASIPGPCCRYVASTVKDLSSCEGYALGGEAFSKLFAAMLDGLAQEYRLHSVARDEAILPLLDASASGGWVDLVIEAACTARGDRTRATQEPRAELVARIAASAASFARDLGHHVRGGGAQRARDLLCQRFAVAPHVVQLDEAGVERALAATTELEVWDLVQALGYLPADQPRRGIVTRAVAAAMDMDGSACAVMAAVASESPSRDEVMRQMSIVARKDGQITFDERALLRGMDAQISEFQHLMSRIDEDTEVDEEEFEQIRSQRQRMLDELFRIALADQQITSDERDLILRAMELVPGLRK